MDAIASSSEGSAAAMDDPVAAFVARVVRPEVRLLDLLAGQGEEEPLAASIHEAVAGQQFGYRSLEVTHLATLQELRNGKLGVDLASCLSRDDRELGLARLPQPTRNLEQLEVTRITVIE